MEVVGIAKVDLGISFSFRYPHIGEGEGQIFGGEIVHEFELGHCDELF